MELVGALSSPACIISSVALTTREAPSPAAQAFGTNPNNTLTGSSNRVSAADT